MPSTIAVVCNLYNEVNALPGWLESATSFADWVGVMNSGPRGAKSDDGTLEILERWRVPVSFCTIDDGYGVVRTKTLRMVPASIDWIILLDADERFHRIAQVMTCAGESTPRSDVDAILYDYSNPDYGTGGDRWPSVEAQVVQPYDAQIEFTACPSNFENLKHLGANLSVSFGEVYNQAAWLRQMMEDNHNLDAIKVVRRHWHDFSHRRPTQNWHTDPDYQMRLLRNRPTVFFSQDTRMHERIVGADCVHDPNFTHGPFFDHYHCHFKLMEADQRRYDVAVYDAIDKGESPPTWEQFLAFRSKS